MFKLIKWLLLLMTGAILVNVIRLIMERSMYTPINDWVEVPMYYKNILYFKENF